MPWVWRSDLIVLGLAAKPVQITVNVRPKTLRSGSSAIPNILGSGGLHAPTTFGIKNRTDNALHDALNIYSMVYSTSTQYLQYGSQCKHFMYTVPPQ